MKINSVQPAMFGAKANIKCIDNKKHPYLYNEINSIVKEFKIPATFRAEEIELPSASPLVLKRLIELDIKFKCNVKEQ